MMTAREMLPAIGQTIQVNFESVWIDCLVTDVKSSWGKPRLEIKPLSGSGSQWVEMTRIRPVAVHESSELAVR